MASFFLACQQQFSNNDEAGEKELDMYSESELAQLMESMYATNMEWRELILADSVPANFPEYFNSIHTAQISEGMTKEGAPYGALADQYLKEVEAITRSENADEAKIAFNQMVNACSSCHYSYCPGPLSRIHKMKIPIHEKGDTTDR